LIGYYPTLSETRNSARLVIQHDLQNVVQQGRLEAFVSVDQGEVVAEKEGTMVRAVLSVSKEGECDDHGQPHKVDIGKTYVSVEASAP